MPRLIFTIALILSAGLANADKRSELIAEIEDAAAHANDDERHEVKIDGCQITTFRWKDAPDIGWTLWSSFQFDMADGQFSARNPDKSSFVYAPTEAEPSEKGIALVLFAMRDGTSARFERSNLRKKDGDAWPSPRGDGTSHHFTKSTSFFFRLEGEGVMVKSKAQKFTSKYNLYVQEYCQFSS